jgi:hypothetical protein
MKPLSRGPLRAKLGPGLVLGLAALLAAAVLVQHFIVPFDPQTRNKLLFLSDTQAPSIFETLFLRPDHNEEATRKILDRAAEEKDVAAAFLLGDVTRAASNESNWKVIDGFLAKLKAEDVPAFGAIGNHDYMWTSKAGERNFLRHFPQLKKLWYSVVVGPVAVIVLNSNFGQMTAKARAEQMTYYQDALDQFGSDPDIRGILVCCHHSPYTNTTVVGPDKKVQEYFVPPFVKSRKGMIFLSGHAHAAEHFVLQGKDFLVLGGGGGLLHPCLTGEKCIWGDVFPIKDQRRLFHYVTADIGDEGLTVAYHMLFIDLTAFQTVGRFSLNWPAPEDPGRR